MSKQFIDALLAIDMAISSFISNWMCESPVTDSEYINFICEAGEILVMIDSAISLYEGEVSESDLQKLESSAVLMATIREDLDVIRSSATVVFH